MPLLQIPSAYPKSAAPKSAGALDFEASTWRQAVNDFRMSGEHKTQRLDEFLKTYTTPQAVSQTLRERQREAPDQYGPVLTKVLSKIDIFLAAGDIAVKGAPESVGLAWTGISLALGSVQDDWATFQLFSGACIDIIGIMVTCRLFGRMFSTSKGPADFFEVQDQVRDSIPKIYDKILEFSYQMFKYMDRNKFLRITRGILKNNKEEFAGGIKDIREGERLMSESATRASQALTSYWQQQSSDKQEHMLSDLKQIRDQLSNSSAASREMNDYLKKELEEQRRKTPMDVARETYTKNKQNLRAVVDAEAMLLKRKAVREDGTCQWIFNTDAYKTWHASSGSGLLWVSGGGNMGKSVLVSSILDQLREDTSMMPDRHAFFFFCKSGDDNAQKSDRIMDHLIWFLYDQVPMSLEMLDRCNDVVRQYLTGRREGRNRKRGEQQELEKVLYFEDAFPKLAVEILKKKVFLVIDALDECSDRKEEELIQRLAMLAKREDLSIKILLTSRPETDISDTMDRCSIPDIRMELFNEGDISKTVEAQLALIPGMTTTERAIARDKICSHAGPYFGYLNPALDLLRRPWQRPIEVHLKQLPDSLLNMNAQVLQNTDPNYIGFLKTCLTWAILANGEQKLKITELSDIYSNRFMEHGENLSGIMQEPEDLTDEVTRFYKSQIRKAGDTFLDLDEKTKELNLIKPALVKDSFLKTDDEAQEVGRRNMATDDCSCKACQARQKQHQTFVLTEKHGHLAIARQIFKHLNSPLFQRTHLGIDESDTLPPDEPKTWNSAQEQGEDSDEDSSEFSGEDSIAETGALSALSQAEINKDVAIQSTATIHVDQTNTKATEADSPAKVVFPTDSANSPLDTTNGVAGRPRLTLDTTDVTESDTASVPENIQDNGMTASPVAASENSDEKPEASDDKDEVTSEADSDLGNDDEPQFVPQTQTGHVYPRYEIAQAIYHLIKVEELWADDTSGVFLELEELFTDAVRFFDAVNPSFHAWKTFELSRPNTPMEGLDATLSTTPLHIAAANGLAELSRRLLNRQAAKQPGLAADAQEAQVQGLISTSEHANDESLLDSATDSSASGHDKAGYKTDINAQLSNGTTPLWWASIVPDNKRRYRVCKLILERGAIPGTEALRQPGGDLAAMEPPFHALLYNKATDLQTVKLFLDHNANVTEIDPYGYNAMHNFAWVGSDPAILDLLMEAGANINVRDDGGETPLHKLLSGQGENMPLALLKRFLFHKADITVEDKDNQQALYEVADGGSAEALKLILAHVPPPDINHKDADGWTALHIAAQWGSVECCRLLTEAGADLLSLDKQSCSPVYVASYSDSVDAIEKIDFLAQASLLRDPEFLRHRTTDGKTIVRKAAANGKTELVKSLLSKYKHALDLNAPDSILGWTPLHVAAYRGFAELVELLLDHGADMKALDKQGKTALIRCYQQWELLPVAHSTQDNFVGALVALIEADRVAAVSETHLLSAAARKGSIPVLEALVLGRPGQPRADPVLRDEFGWTAIELAKQFKRQIAVDFLQQHSGFTGRYPETWKLLPNDIAQIDPGTKELSYTFELTSDIWACHNTIYADCPIPASLDRYYYEISVEFPDPEMAKAKKHYVAMGVFSLGASKYSNGVGLNKAFPGRASSSKRGTQSWAYHGDDGWLGNTIWDNYDERQRKTETFGHGDTVGCGVDFRKGYIFWTKNGRRLMDKAFDDISARLTPVIGLLHPVRVRTTFSRSGPFVWKAGETLDFDQDVPAPRQESSTTAGADQVDRPDRKVSFAGQAVANRTRSGP